MRSYATISPLFWTGETGKKIRSLGPGVQVLALYLITSPHSNMLGLYYLPIPFICHETGLSSQGALKGLQRLSEVGFSTYDAPSEHVFVYEMAKFQIADSLKETDNRVKGINKAYEALANNPFLFDFFERYSERFHLKKQRGSEAPPKPGTGPGPGTRTGPGDSLSGDQEKKKKEKKRTAAPDQFDLTLHLRKWATDLGFTENLDDTTARFLDFHRSKGSLFKDWTAAWRNWIRKAKEISEEKAKPINGQKLSPRQQYMNELEDAIEAVEEIENGSGKEICPTGNGSVGNAQAVTALPGVGV